MLQQYRNRENRFFMKFPPNKNIHGTVTIYTYMQLIVAGDSGARIHYKFKPSFLLAGCNYELDLPARSLFSFLRRTLSIFATDIGAGDSGTTLMASAGVDTMGREIRRLFQLYSYM
jgi:hypothetical protein